MEAAQALDYHDFCLADDLYTGRDDTQAECGENRE
jgi:hypothetical protein